MSGKKEIKKKHFVADEGPGPAQEYSNTELQVFVRARRGLLILTIRLYPVVVLVGVLFPEKTIAFYRRSGAEGGGGKLAKFTGKLRERRVLYVQNLTAYSV